MSAPTSLRWATVSRDGRVLARFTTVRRCEQWIAEREKTDPAGVHRGDYGIDASERAHAEYQRLRSHAKRAGAVAG